MVNCYHWQGDKKLKAVATDVKSSVVKVKREAYYCKEDEIILIPNRSIDKDDR